MSLGRLRVPSRVYNAWCLRGSAPGGGWRGGETCFLRASVSPQDPEPEGYSALARCFAPVGSTIAPKTSSQARRAMPPSGDVTKSQYQRVCSLDLLAGHQCHDHHGRAEIWQFQLAVAKCNLCRRAIHEIISYSYPEASTAFHGTNGSVLVVYL